MTAPNFATENNLCLTGDMPRRTIDDRLDACVERPEERELRTEDTIDTPKRERPRYLAGPDNIARLPR
jgi:hypothetical protein